jgi:lysophospholipase L1-like esterase
LLIALTAGASAGIAQSASTEADHASADHPSEKPLSQSEVLHDIRDFGGLSQYAAENAALPKVVPGRVVFLGDSITEFWTENGGKFFPGKPYLNRGIAAQSTAQMLIRFRQDVIDLKPTAVVIQGGLADVAGFTGPSSLEEIEDNFRSMAELARFNHIAVVLAVSPPAADYPGRKGVEPTLQLAQLNKWASRYCAMSDCTYLNYYAAMVGPDGQMKAGISKDGVHPNAAGYAIMEPLAERAIAEAMRSHGH